MNNLHDQLKSATHDAHMKMHEHEFLAPLSGSLDKGQYVEILKGFYDFYGSTERVFNAHSKFFEDELTPLKTIEKDFSLLAIKTPPESPEVFEGEDNFSSYIGYLYVKQGSTLGGQMISKHIEKETGLRKRDQICFFNPYGNETGQKWKKFLKLLNDTASDIDVDKAVKTAENTFTHMDNVFYKHLELRVHR